MRSGAGKRFSMYLIALAGVLGGLLFVSISVFMYLEGTKLKTENMTLQASTEALLKYDIKGPVYSLDLVGTENILERMIVAPLFNIKNFEGRTTEKIKLETHLQLHHNPDAETSNSNSRGEARPAETSSMNETDSKPVLWEGQETGATASNVENDEDNNQSEADAFMPPGVSVQQTSPQRKIETKRHGVRILQIGDSHTAADFFTGELRRIFQARFGNGGVGYIEPGKPHPGLRHSSLSISASPDWIYTSLQRSQDRDNFYLSGFNATARARGATLNFSSEQKNPWDQLEIEVLFGPGEGTLLVSIDGQRLFKESLRSERPERRVLRSTPQRGRLLMAQRLSLETASDEPVTVGSVAFFNLQSGVSVSKIGFPGATVDILNKITERTFADELRRLTPQIIIIAFGTNEGFNDNLDLASWTRNYSHALGKIQTVLPEARIVLITPPAASRVSSSLCSPPPNLERVRSQIIEIARREGLLYWDWSKLMPEKCGAQAWASATPRLMADDLVHLTKTGYEVSARQFANILFPILNEMRKKRHAVSDN